MSAIFASLLNGKPMRGAFGYSWYISEWVLLWAFIAEAMKLSQQAGVPSVWLPLYELQLQLSVAAAQGEKSPWYNFDNWTGP